MNAGAPEPAGPAVRDHPGDWRVGLMAWLAATFIRLLRATVRIEHHGDQQVRRWERDGQPYILTFWHRHLLLMRYAYRGRRMSVLISASRDGELIARTIVRLGPGIETSRGSSSRGGAAGLRSLLRKARQGYDLTFTPDGPRGPLRQVQPGVILAAAASGLPILPVAMAASRAKLLRSWDRFVVPLPGSRVCFVYGEPLVVARDADPAVSAPELALRLNAAEAAAERLAGARAEEPSSPA